MTREKQVPSDAPTKSSVPLKLERKKDPTASKKRKKSCYDSYETYLHRLFKERWPELSQTAGALATMDSMLKDVSTKICTGAARICKAKNKQTLSEQEVRAASEILLPAELYKRLAPKMVRAVKKYKEYSQ